MPLKECIPEEIFHKGLPSSRGGAVCEMSTYPLSSGRTLYSADNSSVAIIAIFIFSCAVH